jgi:hypothetical protein
MYKYNRMMIQPQLVIKSMIYPQIPHESLSRFSQVNGDNVETTDL